MSEGFDGRRIVIALLLPVIIFFDRFAYYGARAGLYAHAVNTLGIPADSYWPIYRGFTTLAVFAPLAGGVLAALVGPRVPIIVGCLVAGLGYVTLGVADARALMPALVLVALGTGLLKPGLFVAAAEVFPDPRRSFRDASFVVLYAAINVAALSAPLAVSAMNQVGGATAVFRACAGAALTGAALGGVVLGVHLLLPREAEPRRARLAWAGALLLVALLVAQSLGMTLFGQMADQAFGASAFGGEDARFIDLLWSINPSVVVGTSVLLAAGLVALGLSRPVGPTLLVVGIGLVAYGAGALLMATERPTHVTALVSVVVAGIGEALLVPLALSRIASAVGRHAAPLLVALCLVATTAVSFAANALPEGLLARLGFVAAATGCLVGGALVLTLLDRFSALFDSGRP